MIHAVWWTSTRVGRLAGNLQTSVFSPVVTYPVVHVHTAFVLVLCYNCCKQFINVGCGSMSSSVSLLKKSPLPLVCSKLIVLSLYYCADWPSVRRSASRFKSWDWPVEFNTELSVCWNFSSIKRRLAASGHPDDALAYANLHSCMRYTCISIAIARTLFLMYSFDKWT